MSHQVLSRKYRPQRFDELVGQDHVARILQNALTSDRVGHAYLLVGPRGVGKTTMARIFARALNCAQRGASGERPEAPAGFEPCGRCPSCIDIAAGCDLDVVEMDAASNNAVDDVRALREQVGYATVRSPYRIWIVDEVHMLSLPAFNAFLKTLEEPPEQVKFLFCTTEEHKLPATFRSRCQRVEFRPIAERTMAARLEDLAAREGVGLQAGVSEAIACCALGGLRDAESQLEQLIAARVGDEAIGLADLDALSGRAPGELLERLGAAVDHGDAAAALDAVDACLATGSKPGVLIDQWLETLRARLVQAARGDADPPPRGGVAGLARAIDVLLAKRVHLRAGAEGGLVLQVAAVELARLPDARDLDALIAALRAGGGPAGRAPDAGGGPARARASGTAGRPPAPATSPPVAAGGGSPAGGSVGPAGSLHAHRDALLRAAEARSPALARALRKVQFGAVGDGTVQVAADEEDSSTRATLMRKEIQLAFGQLVRELTGEYLRPVLIDAPSPPAAAAPGAEDLRAHPAVQFVTEKTGGRLLHVEREAPAEPAARPTPTRKGSRRGGKRT